MDKLSLITMYPEILLLVMASVITMVDLFVKSPGRGVTWFLTALTLIAALILQVSYFDMTFKPEGSQVVFNGMYVSDALSNILKIFILITTLGTLVYSRQYVIDRDMLKRGGEFYALILFGVLGMFLMVSSRHFVPLYLGLELLTLSSYALVALRRDHTLSLEAAMKYFVLGALASGFLLYGMSIIYGATGELHITKIVQILAQLPMNAVLALGLVFIVASLAFKLGVVPFHMWVPDIYQGAPTAITLFIASSSKIAAFGFVFRILIEGFFPLFAGWQDMLMTLAVASLLVGNLAAIMQTNLKRMLAYSTIAQMGFMLMGLAIGIYVKGDGLIDEGVEALVATYAGSLFYTVTYALTTLATLGVVMVLSKAGFESENISDFAGLNARNPLAAFIVTLCMLSMAGIPPLVGFYAKFAILKALIQTGSMLYIGIAIFAIIMSLIAVFYYINIIKVMYFSESTNKEPIALALFQKICLILNVGIFIIFAGIYPQPLISLFHGVMAVTMLQP